MERRTTREKVTENEGRVEKGEEKKVKDYKGQKMIQRKRLMKRRIKFWINRCKMFCLGLKLMKA